jgi:septal ring factor EnvC (AmiA/AmiB activator)
MSDPYTDQAAALAALSSENGVLRAEIARVRAERDDWRDTAEAGGKIADLKDREIERMTEKEISKAWFDGDVHSLRAEVEQLTAALQMCRDMASINLKMALDHKTENERLRAQLDDGPAVTDILHELRADNERLRTGIDQIVGMCLGDVGIGKIHAAACALLTGQEEE